MSTVVITVVALLGGLVLTEVGLRIASWARTRDRTATLPGAPAASGCPTLLCVGDSNTYGLNLPRGESYPCHLQALVGDRARVVNRGWPGASSSLMAAYLPGWLATYRPQVVYVMAGINNRHNPLGGTYDAIIDRGIFRPTWFERLRHKLHRGGWYLHTYRLVYWSFAASEGGWSEAVAPSDEVYGYFRGKPYDSYETFQKHSMTREIPDPWSAIESEGLEPTAAAAVICGYFNAIGPGAELSEYDINLVRYARDTLGKDGEAAVLDAARSGLSAHGYRTLTEAVGRVARDVDLVEQILWYDLAQMHRDCVEAGAQLVVLTYPSQVFGALLAEFSKRHGVPWVDSQAAFGPMGIKRHEKTANGKRLNSSGNLRLAQHVLAESLRRGLVDLDGASSAEPGAPARAS